MHGEKERPKNSVMAGKLTRDTVWFHEIKRLTWEFRVPDMVFPGEVSWITPVMTRVTWYLSDCIFWEKCATFCWSQIVCSLWKCGLKKDFEIPKGRDDYGGPEYASTFWETFWGMEKPPENFFTPISNTLKKLIAIFLFQYSLKTQENLCKFLISFRRAWKRNIYPKWVKIS